MQINNDSVDMDTMPLRWAHIKVFLISSTGQALGSGLATLIGIILPMIQMLAHPHLSSLEQGIISCMSLLGIVVGSFMLGTLSDKYGYLKLFRLCPLVILFASLVCFAFSNVIVLAICLFIMGLGIGGEYTLGSDYISEIMPQRWKLLMVGAAKATSALGSITVAGLSYLFMTRQGNAEHWHILLLLVLAMSFMMFVSRINFAQSPGWLVAHGRIDEAEKSVKFLLGNDVVIGDIKNKQTDSNQQETTIADLFKKGNILKVIFSSIPWACSGFGVYGIGIFLPILILALHLEPVTHDPFLRIIHSVELTSIINVFVLIGFVIGLLIINKIYHLKIQVWGFILSSVGLFILLLGYKLSLPIWVAVVGFLIFELFLNAGPNLMTFIIPPQIYSVAERGAGVGLSASIGKIGAVISVFFIPNLLAWGGIELVLIVAILTNLLGAIITQYFGREVLPEEHNRKIRKKFSFISRIRL